MGVPGDPPRRPRATPAPRMKVVATDGMDVFPVFLMNASKLLTPKPECQGPDTNRTTLAVVCAIVGDSQGTDLPVWGARSPRNRPRRTPLVRAKSEPLRGGLEQLGVLFFVDEFVA